MSLKQALDWWIGDAPEPPDTAFIEGYRKALEDAANLVKKSIGFPVVCQDIRRLNNWEENFGN